MSARQLALELGQRPAFGREDFLVAPSNQDAVAWLDRWPAWPDGALAIYGPSGCGKTHLAHVWQKRSGARLVFAASLTPDGVPALAGSAVVVEGGEAGFAEAALLHLRNLLREQGGSLLITGCIPPSQWSVRLPDLRSRLAAMPAVAVAAPDDALLGGVLLKLFADRQLRVGEDVVLFLLARMERSFAAAQEIVARLDQAALAQRRSINVTLARQVLETTQE